MRTSAVSALICAALMGGPFTCAGAAAQTTIAETTAAETTPLPEKPGINCVRTDSIQQTTPVDPRTIVITLVGRNHYKRLDMAEDCSGLMFHGFAYSTPTNELCNTSPLHIIQEGEICMIRDIVDIGPDEAKALLRKKR